MMKIGVDNTEATQKLDDTGSKIKSFGSKFGSGLKTAGAVAAKGIAVATTAAAAAVGGVVAITNSTREYRVELGKMTAAAEANGYSAEFTKQQYMELNSVMADDQAAATTISNLTAIGLSNEDLEKTIHSCIGVWSAYGDSIPLDGLAESINETVKVGQVTGNLADALNWCGISEDDFNASLAACTTEQERQQLVVDTLDKAYGGLADSYMESNASVISLQAAQQSMTDSMAMIGGVLEPYVASFTQATATILQGFALMVQGEEEGRVKMDEGIQMFVENLNTMLPKVIEFAVTMIGTLAQAILENLPTLINAGFQMMTTLLNELLAHLPEILEMGIQAILAFADGLADATPDLVPKIVDAVITIVTTIITHLPEIIAAGVKIIAALIEGLINSIPTLVSRIPEIVTAIVNAFGSLAGSFVDIGKNIINGIWQGISSMASWLVDKVKGIGSSIVNGFKGFLGIHSPSRVFADISKYIPEGIAVGIEDNTEEAVAAVAGMSEKVADAFNPQLSMEGINLSGYRKGGFSNKYSQPGYSVSGGGNNVVQNNYFTSKEMSSYEQQVQIKRLQRDLVGGMA